ncbi:DUF192 domain-containing protein [Patescibacteria group bacterium]
MKKIINIESIAKRKKTIAIIAAVFVVLYYFIIANNLFFYSLEGNRVRKVYVGDHEFRMEMVDDTKSLSKGLGGRNQICGKCGMFFDFGKDDNHGMWMKDVNFDLDIIWIRDGEVIWIEENISHQNKLNVYGTSVTSDAVLEVNAGLVDAYGIKRGDQMVIK